MSIREFAEQAGMHSPDGFKLTVGHMAMFQLEKFAELVAAHKREELLDIVYGYANHLRNDEAFQEAIRARGKA